MFRFLAGGIGWDFEGRKGCRTGKVHPRVKEVGESEASVPSEAPPRWGGASVPEKHRQDTR